MLTGRPVNHSIKKHKTFFFKNKKVVMKRTFWQKDRVHSSETLVQFYQTTWHHSPDDGILQDRYCFLIQHSLHCLLNGQVSCLSHLWSWKGLFSHTFVFKIYICQNGVTPLVSVPVPSITLIHNLTCNSTNLDPDKEDM